MSVVDKTFAPFESRQLDAHHTKVTFGNPAGGLVFLSRLWAKRLLNGALPMQTEPRLQTGKVLVAGAWTFVGVFLLTLLPIMFLRVTVRPATEWSLRVQGIDRLSGALAASATTAGVLAVIIVAGMLIARCFESHSSGVTGRESCRHAMKPDR